MTPQSIKLLKFVSFTVVLSIFSLIVIGAVSDDKTFQQRSESTTKNTLIKSSENAYPIRDSIVNFGIQLLDTPYLAAGSSKDGFDCSGFVYYVFQHFKIEVPRSSPQYKNFGKEIPIDSAKKGDVLVFLSPTNNVIGHIGIITDAKGMQSDFIHATSGRQMKVVISSLKQPGYKLRFLKAVRVFN